MPGEALDLRVSALVTEVIAIKHKEPSRNSQQTIDMPCPPDAHTSSLSVWSAQ